jgi:hypothetical protein
MASLSTGPANLSGASGENPPELIQELVEKMNRYGVAEIGGRSAMLNNAVNYARDLAC